MTQVSDCFDKGSGYDLKREEGGDEGEGCNERKKERTKKFSTENAGMTRSCPCNVVKTCSELPRKRKTWRIFINSSSNLFGFEFEGTCNCFSWLVD